MALMKEVRPDLDEEGHEFLFQIADKAGDGTIDVIDFLAVRMEITRDCESHAPDRLHCQDEAHSEPGRQGRELRCRP